MKTDSRANEKNRYVIVDLISSSTTMCSEPTQAKSVGLALASESPSTLCAFSPPAIPLLFVPFTFLVAA